MNVDYSKASWGQKILDTSSIKFKEDEGRKKTLSYISCITIGVLTIGIPHLIHYIVYGRGQPKPAGTDKTAVVSNQLLKPKTSVEPICKNIDIFVLVKELSENSNNLYAYPSLLEDFITQYDQLPEDKKTELLNLIDRCELKNEDKENFKNMLKDNKIKKDLSDYNSQNKENGKPKDLKFKSIESCFKSILEEANKEKEKRKEEIRTRLKQAEIPALIPLPEES